MASWQSWRENYQLRPSLAHLLRYLAIGSAGLLRRSLRKPEKLKAGSSFFGVEASAWNGSNSDTSGRALGVCEEGVASGRFLEVGFGAGAEGVFGLTGAGVSIASNLDGPGVDMVHYVECLEERALT